MVINNLASLRRAFTRSIDRQLDPIYQQRAMEAHGDEARTADRRRWLPAKCRHQRTDQRHRLLYSVCC